MMEKLTVLLKLINVWSETVTIELSGNGWHSNGITAARLNNDEREIMLGGINTTI